MKNFAKIIIISLMLILPLVNLSFAASSGIIGSDAWKIVKLMNRYSDADPLFYVLDTRVALFKNSVNYLMQYKIAPYWRNIILSAHQIECNYSEYTENNAYFTILEVHAIRRITAGNVRSLTSINVGDVNKIKVSSAYPEFYYVWGDKIGFAPPPAGICTLGVYAYWKQRSSTIMDETDRSLFHPAFRHVLYFYLSSLYKEREGNMAGASNLRQIANSMLYDMLQIFDMAEKSVDLKIAPEIYEE